MHEVFRVGEGWGSHETRSGEGRDSEKIRVEKVGRSGHRVRKEAQDGRRKR